MKESYYKAFVFDMDGTLVDTILDMMEAVNYALSQFSLPIHTKEEYVTYIGNGSAMLIKRALGEEHLDLFEPVFKTYYEYYNKNYTAFTKPYQGIVEALEYAKEHQIKLFVYTNKPEKIALEVANHCFGENYFDELIGIPLGGVVKPDPKAYWDRTEKYHIPFERQAYFGDSETDILTSYRIGIENMYSVAWGYKSKEFLENFTPKPKRILDDPLEIIKVINNAL